jgi:hypothetical protein
MPADAFLPPWPARAEAKHAPAAILLRLVDHPQPGAILPAVLARAAPGQRFAATVLAPPSAGRVPLRLGGETVTAVIREGIALAPGETITLQVQERGPPMILKLLPPDTEALARAWRQALARAQPLEPLLRALAAFAAKTPPPRAPDRESASGLSGLAQRFLDRLPGPGTLMQATGLKQAIAGSGLFLEARLAAGLPPSEGDLKALLLRLVHSLQARLPPIAEAQAKAVPAAAAPDETAFVSAELLHHADGALAGLLLDQLACHSAQSEKGMPVWSLILPWREGEHLGVLRLRIERERDQPPAAHRGAPAESGGSWRVWLHLDPPGLGTIHAELRLAGLHTDVTLWAESESTAARIAGALARLRSGLEGAGLEVGALDCHTGRPAAMRDENRRPPFSLLEEKA